MEAYCESKGLTITARYQEVGRGWSKKRPEFQRMLADARKGRFDTIVCWKSDRLSRGMYPAAALMEVVEAHQIRLEAALDAIDMKTFGLMAAIGKIERDNFRERSTMGKRWTAKQGRAPTGRLPYGFRIGDDGRPEVVEEQAEVVRRIFRMYVDEGMRAYSIAARLTDEWVPTQAGKLMWLQSRVHHILGNATYTGSWVYGKYRHVSTEDGMKVYDQPKDTWIEIPVPQVVDDKTWKRAQKLKKQRSRKAKRNTKVLYLLQHLLKCAECGRNFHTRASWTTTSVRNGKPYSYELTAPRPYYMCNGMQGMRLRCREKPYIRAEQVEEVLAWARKFGQGLEELTPQERHDYLQMLVDRSPSTRTTRCTSRWLFPSTMIPQTPILLTLSPFSLSLCRLAPKSLHAEVHLGLVGSVLDFPFSRWDTVFKFSLLFNYGSTDSRCSMPCQKGPNANNALGSWCRTCYPAARCGPRTPRSFLDTLGCAPTF